MKWVLLFIMGNGGNTDEAYEFEMMFADLCAECERMHEDLQKEYVPECFDRFFVAVRAGELCIYMGGWQTILNRLSD